MYGFLLDGWMFVVSHFPDGPIIGRIFWFAVGISFTTFGISTLFNTYISPEAYELFVKKVSEKFSFPLFKVKYAYDFCSLILSISLSLIFFSSFNGIGAGTVVSALLNGRLIAMWTGILHKKFIFEDKLKLRKYFEK